MSNATRRIVTTRMTLDLNIPDIQRDITVTQGDTNRRLEITLVDSGHPYVLDANDKWSVILTGIKPSGASLYNGCDVAGGKIIYDFATGDQITTEAGAFGIQFDIYDESGEVIATPKIWVTVTPNANRDAVTMDQFTAIANWIDTLNQYEKSEGTRAADENTRQANEAERKTAEAERKAAEEQRKQNEAAREGLQQQVNNLLNTPAGSTTADLALYDLKLGADGVTYDTPGIAVRTQLGRLQGKVPEIDKRLANVESILDPQLFVDDNTAAAVKTVPETSAPYAKITKIGGKTRKCTNLIPFPYTSGGSGTVIESNGGRIEVGTDGGLTISGTLTGYIGFRLYQGELLYKGPQTVSRQGNSTNYYLTVFLYSDANYSTQVARFDVTSYAVTIDTNDYPTAIRMIIESSRASNSAMAGTAYPTLNPGNTALPYEPFFEGLRSAPVTEVESAMGNVRHAVLPIPEAVQGIDGYGWGINESVYNYIDFEKKQFVKRVGKKVLNGTEHFTSWTNGNEFLGIWLEGVDYDFSNGLDIRGVCNHYDVGVGGTLGIKSVRFRQNGDVARWYFYDDALTSADAWKNRFAELYAEGNPVTILYKLDTPEVRNISDLLPADNLIPVEAGGTVTFVNEYEYDVPNEVRYQLKRTERKVLT